MSLRAHKGRCAHCGFDHDSYRASFKATAPASPAEPSEKVLELVQRLFEDVGGLDRSSTGYHWRKGWNDALRRVMDYVRGGVLATLRHDNIGEAFFRLDKGQVHRADGGQILADDALGRTPALGHVALEPADEAQIGVRIHVDLHVEDVA